MGTLASLLAVGDSDVYELYKKSCTILLKWNGIKDGLLNSYSPEPEELDEPQEDQMQGQP